ncbi:MAG TPA: TonB C-terminal domain-containing protein [Luteimonas sp.]
MRETRADTAQALLLALLLHLVLFGLAFLGLWWTRDNAVSAAGSPVEADLVDPDALSAATRRVLAAPPKPAEPVEAPPPTPQPEPESRPQDSPVPPQTQAQERVPVPDAVEQERVDRDAISAETREREQEEKRRQEQIDLTERERQEEIEKRRRLAQMQAERAQQIADIRKQRAQAAKEISRAEQNLKQLAAAQAATLADSAASASPPPGNNGIDASLLAKYQAAIQAAIQSQWVKPDNVPEGAICRLTIRQLPGGEVAAGGVSFGSPCQFDEVARDSIERAVLKAEPLPYRGFEKVFNRTLNLNFEAQSR